MELAKRHNHVVSGGNIGEKSEFNIAMNAKMFRVLSDTMYQDKVGSMVRELSCNAMDAHIEAGTPDLPFDIHLPDSIEPWFSVKDTGVGMSDENLRTMYTTYGESTKDESNEMVGAFGLGSKTPFAYTDQFTVTSIFDGVKRIYVAVMNDDGLPVLMLQGESETTEHAGLEVNVSVRDADYDSFRSAVTKQLQFFAVKPNLLNNRQGIEFKDFDNTDEINIDMDGIRVYNGGYNANIKGIWIVQGGVGYPLSLESLGDIKADVKSFAQTVHSKGAILHFPIGQIEVTASREGISYTDRVIERITKRLTEVARLLCKDALAEISKEGSIWNRVVIYNNMLDVIQKAIRQSADFDNLFRGTVIDQSNMSMDIDRLAKLGFRAIYMQKHTGRKRGSYSSDGDFVRMIRKTVGAEFGGRYGSITKLHPTNEMLIFVRDTNSKPVARVKKLMNDQDWPTVLMIEGGDSNDITAKNIGQISMALGVSKGRIRLLSSLEAPKTAKGASGQYGTDRRPRAWEMPENGNMSYSRDWTPIYDDLDDYQDAVYFEMDRHDVSWGENGKAVLEAARAGNLDLPIIAVNGQTYQRILNGKIGGHLVTVDAAAKPILAKIEEIKPVIRAIGKYKSFLSAFKGSSSLIQSLSQRGAIKSIGRVQKRIEQLEERVEGWGYIQNYASVDAQPAKDAGSEAGKVRSAEVLRQYPMLNHLSSYSTDADVINDVIEYIEMVDKRG